MKKFKSKRKHYILVMIIIFIILFFVSYKLTKDQVKKYLSDDVLAKIIVNDYDFKISDLKKPEVILKYSFKEKEEIVEMVNKEEDNKPIIYLYNSHPLEKYSFTNYEAFNINPTVVTASYILKEYLDGYGIKSLVESKSVDSILKNKGWKYGSSYRASRILIEEASSQNPSLRYYFDIHRDSSLYEKTVTEIDGVKYARLLFVVGLENNNYEVNLAFANDLNNRLKEIDKSLSRGIVKKSGVGVNGIYNQDFSPRSMLIEIGGQDNSINEINETIKCLAKIIKDYIGDNNGKEEA